MSDATGHFQQEVAGNGAADEAPQCSGQPDIIALLNRGYVCPSWAGPAWRQAHAAGVDMELIEEALRKSPAERLREHQRALNLILIVVRARRPNDTGS